VIPFGLLIAEFGPDSSAGEVRRRRFFSPTLDSVPAGALYLCVPPPFPFFSVVPSIAAFLCSQTDRVVSDFAGRELANEKFGVLFKPPLLSACRPVGGALAAACEGLAR